MESDGIASSMARPAPPSPRTPEHIDTTLPSAPPAESSQQHQLPASQSSAVTHPLNRVSCSSEQPGPGATAPSTGDLELGSVDLSRSTTPTTLVAGRGGFAALEGPRGGARAAKDVGSDAVVGVDNAGRWRGARCQGRWLLRRHCRCQLVIGRRGSYATRAVLCDAGRESPSDFAPVTTILPGAKTSAGGSRG